MLYFYQAPMFADAAGPWINFEQQGLRRLLTEHVKACVFMRKHFVNRKMTQVSLYIN